MKIVFFRLNIVKVIEEMDGEDVVVVLSISLIGWKKKWGKNMRMVENFFVILLIFFVRNVLLVFFEGRKINLDVV